MVQIDGLEGMSRYSANELFVMAEEYESKINDINNTDDPKWLKRRAEKITCFSHRKRKSKRT